MMRHVHALLRVLRPRLLAVVALSAGTLPWLVTERGWAVAVTDYPGLGTPGDETYSVGIAEGRAVLDALRSATLLRGAGLSTTAPMGLEGYSQGGGAAGWAAQLQPWYAPGLRLQGIAMGGTPANLQAVAANINGTAFFAFLGGSAIGFNAAYPSRKPAPDLPPRPPRPPR